ncbi:MAG: glucose 1-dehydrogenase [Candidatus Thermoplasmatota archaeon]|jgi:NAD(P)-dependent dehydrogenase (short-subunit alcohol dehydrogenase family)
MAEVGMTLKDKVAIVTGAGAGIGKAIVLHFAKEGAKVVAAGRNKKDLDTLVADLQEWGGTVLAVEADVSNPTDVARIFDKAIAKFGRIDVLVNNAGIMDDFTPVAEVTDDLWRRVMGTNLDGVFYGCRLAVKAMLGQGSGSIINIASIGGLQGGRAGAAYTASKHAVIGLTKNIGYMYAKTGIRCNAIAPGGVATTIGQKMKPHPFGYERMAAGIANAVRVGTPEEIAAMAVFLASDESSLMNGAIVTADAGWTAY